MTALDADSPIPLYHQLADWLLDQIQRGQYAPGSRIPSEPELSRRFGIGRPTVRQATELLVRGRRLERRRGAGTFVVEPPPQVDLLSLAGTMASLEKTGKPFKTALVERTRRVPVPAEDVENPFAGRTAWFLSRVSRLSGTPVLLESLWLDPDAFPGLDRIALAGRSLAELAREHYGLRPESADQDFRVAELPEARADTLGLPAGTPILLVKRRIHFPDRTDAVFSELACRTDRFVFSQSLGGGLDA